MEIATGKVKLICNYKTARFYNSKIQPLIMAGFGYLDLDIWILFLLSKSRRSNFKLIHLLTFKKIFCF